MSRKRLIGPIAILVLFPLLIGSSCDDEGDTIINSVLENPPNEPPTIVAQGPEFPAGGVEVVGEYGYDDSPNLWVLVGDPNGLEDIAAVFIQIDTVIVSRVLIRPDSGGSFCAVVSYAANDTIDTSGLLPAGFPRVQSQPLELVQGGLYSTDSFFSIYGVAFPAIEELSDSFGPPIKGCTSGLGGYIRSVGLYTPLVPTDVDGFLTLAEVQYQGITITAYDKEGETAVASFPDLPVLYTTTREKEVAP